MQTLKFFAWNIFKLHAISFSEPENVYCTMTFIMIPYQCNSLEYQV